MYSSAHWLAPQTPATVLAEAITQEQNSGLRQVGQKPSNRIITITFHNHQEPELGIELDSHEGCNFATVHFNCYFKCLTLCIFCFFIYILYNL